MEPEFQFEFSTSSQTGVLTGNAEFFREILEALWSDSEHRICLKQSQSPLELKLCKRLTDELSQPITTTQRMVQ